MFRKKQFPHSGNMCTIKCNDKVTPILFLVTRHDLKYVLGYNFQVTANNRDRLIRAWKTIGLGCERQSLLALLRLVKESVKGAGGSHNSVSC